MKQFNLEGGKKGGGESKRKPQNTPYRVKKPFSFQNALSEEFNKV